MKRLEDFWYEASPFVYGLLGLAVLLNGDGLIAKGSGALLMLAGLTIVGMRWRYRVSKPAPDVPRKTAIRPPPSKPSRSGATKR